MSTYAEILQQVKDEGLFRTLPQIKLCGKYIEMNGRSLLNLNGNDYLGLLDCPELWTEFLDTSAHLYAPSSASSRLLTGNDEIYHQFEDYLRTAYSAESALIWDSGYHANSGILPVLTDHDTLIVADRLVHASIIEGIRLSGASFVRFRHNDLDHLSQILREKAPQFDKVWIVTEGVFSMDGDRAPLAEIVEFKHIYNNVYVYVDEAHSVGVFGNGLGLSVELGLSHEIDLLIGTLGKALGSVGAYSLQSSVIRDLLVSRARPFIFSTALPPVMVAWSLFLFQKVREMEHRRSHLFQLMQLMGTEHHQLSSPITAIIIPGIEAVTSAAAALLDQGYFVRPIRRPTVPAGSERLRISLTAAMTPQEVMNLKQALAPWY